MHKSTLKLLFTFALVLGFFQFSQAQTARLQVIHNAADPALDTVDVWLVAGGTSTKLLDNFPFRNATPYIDAPAGQQITVGLALKNSTAITDTAFSFDYNLTAGQTYVLVANGVTNSMNFAANPDSRSTMFDLLVQPNGQESGTGQNVDFCVVHGSTDAPFVDVRVQGGATLVNNAGYRDITSYLSVPAGPYVLEITDSAQTAVVATYNVDLTGLDGGAAVVFASGFFSNGMGQTPNFGLFAALADSLGTVVEFSPVVSIDPRNESASGIITTFPHPANDVSTVRYTIEKSAVVNFTLVDVNGRAVREVELGNQTAGEHDFRLDLENLTGGIYFLRMQAGDIADVKKLMIQQ